MNPWLMLAVAIAVEVVGSTALKASEGFTRPLPSLVMAAAYVTTFFLLAQILRSLPLGLTYALWAGVGTALTAVVGWLYFRDPFNWTAAGGIALVVAGVALLNLSGAARH